VRFNSYLVPKKTNCPSVFQRPADSPLPYFFGDPGRVTIGVVTSSNGEDPGLPVDKPGFERTL